MRDSIAGPCVVCGATDYELSSGGPTICPYCDCGRDPEIGRLISLGGKQAVEITGLRAENAILRESLTRKGKSTFLEFVSLREKLATVTSEKMNAITECGRLETERDDLKIALITANERLATVEKDAERIQWWFNRPQIDLGPGKDYLFINVARANTLQEWRAAIDAACKGE